MIAKIEIIMAIEVIRPISPDLEGFLLGSSNFGLLLNCSYVWIGLEVSFHAQFGELQRHLHALGSHHNVSQVSGTEHLFVFLEGAGFFKDGYSVGQP